MHVMQTCGANTCHSRTLHPEKHLPPPTLFASLSLSCVFSVLSPASANTIPPPPARDFQRQRWRRRQNPTTPPPHPTTQRPTGGTDRAGPPRSRRNPSPIGSPPCVRPLRRSPRPPRERPGRQPLPDRAHPRQAREPLGGEPRGDV